MPELLILQVDSLPSLTLASWPEQSVCCNFIPAFQIIGSQGASFRNNRYFHSGPRPSLDKYRILTNSPLREDHNNVFVPERVTTEKQSQLDYVLQERRSINKCVFIHIFSKTASEEKFFAGSK